MVRCSICNQELGDGPHASGRDGLSHARCAKVGMAHGQSIDLLEAFDQIGALKKRTQELEQAVESLQRTVNFHERSIDFRVGGGG